MYLFTWEITRKDTVYFFQVKVSNSEIGITEILYEHIVQETLQKSLS